MKVSSRPARRRRLRERLRAHDERPEDARAEWSPGFRAALSSIAFGITAGLAVVGLGIFFLAREGGFEQPGAASDHSESTTGSGDGQTGAGGALDVEINAQHLGNLQLLIQAFLSKNADQDPLIDAEVVAYTDMVQMPQGHSQGPLPMQPVPDRPGFYYVQTAVPMVGDYEVRVEVKSPETGEATTTVPVGVVSESPSQ